jgi:uncharacterized protein YaaQ
MKLVIAIIQDYDCDQLLSRLAAMGCGATKVASEGGFLRVGNTTVFSAVPDERVAEVVEAVRGTGGRRPESPLRLSLAELADEEVGCVAPCLIGGGVIFIATVARFERLAEEAPAQLAEVVGRSG